MRSKTFGELLPIMFSLLLCIALTAGCGTADRQGQALPADQPAQNQPAEERPSEGQPQNEARGGTAGAQQADAQQGEKHKQQVTVYYTDPELTKLVSEQREIEYATEREKYEQSIRLLTNPKEQGHIALWPELKYHSLVVENGKATIDMDGSVQYNLGSGGEALAIEALTSTLFQFPEIDRVQILVDGEVRESLMGHVDISEPFKREK
ncbi:GerMN domain-containing protein [Bacillaceae bacterium]